MINDDVLVKVMGMCINLAKNNIKINQYPIAAIVADSEGIVLTASCSNLKKRNDPTNHPEIEVIRNASDILKSRHLEGLYLFSTLEPCPMCTSAAIWAKMQGIVYGACLEDALEYISMNPNRKFSWRQINIKSKDVIKEGDPKLELYEGVLREECKKLFI